MTGPSPLDLPLETMRTLGYRVTDVVAGHLASLRDQPVFSQIHRKEADRLLLSPPPEVGTDFEALLGTLQSSVFRRHAREPHPGFIAYIPSCPTFPAVMGDWLASGFNLFAGVWPVGGGANELEVVVLDWFRRWLGMPDGAGGLLTSGGSAATLTAVVAARHAAVGDNPSRLPRLTFYTSQQAHSSVFRAAWVAGVPRAQVRSVPTDARQRMDLAALGELVRQDRAAGFLPFMVAASAGTTNTGSVDPLPGLGAFCSEEELWLHVDAAYGGFAVLTDRGRAALAGIELADSITLDPHKWLFVPFECGCLMVRKPAWLKAAFQIYPEYLHDVQEGGDDINFADYGIQLTRYSRAIKVWMSVRYFGMKAIRDAIDGAMDLARLAERLVVDNPRLELLSPARLGICCFRAHPQGMDDPGRLDTLNERIDKEVNGSGRYFISSTVLDKKLSLRVCILGFRTTEADIRGVMDAISACSVEFT